MAKTKISEFSATPANNTDIDSINIAEGCAPSGINDAIRELMAQLKDFQTGAVGDSFNGPVGTSTAAAGAFTTLAASGAVTLSGGTANGVTYLNGSKVLTSGSALTFDGTALAVGTSTIGTNNRLTVDGGRLIVANGPTGSSSSATKGLQMYFDATNNQGYIFSTQSGVANYPLNVSSSTLSLASSLTTFTISGSEAMRLDSAGNLGLGVTPNTWTLGKSISVGDVGSAVFGFGGYNSLTSGAYFNSGWKYSSSSSSQKPALFVGSDGAFSWSTAPSGTAGNAITFTQAMTLDASGNLGVGTTSPSQRLHVSNASGGSNILVANGTNAASNIYIATDGFAATTGSIYTNGSAPLAFGTNSTERARITAAGELLLTGLTSPITSGILCIATNLNNNNPVVLKNTTTQGSGQNFAVFTNSSNAQAGAIQHSGSTSVTYSTSSDARLKTDLGVSISTDVIDNTVIHNFEWKEDKQIDRGVFAQEAYEVKPSAVSVGNDELTEDGNLAKPWGVDYSKYVPDLIVHAQQLKKQVQEQQALIQSLKARLDAANL